MIHTYFINNTRWLKEAVAKAWREAVIVARALRSIAETGECPGGALGGVRGASGVPMGSPGSAACIHDYVFSSAV